jgi:hypothetical protein
VSADNFAMARTWTSCVEAHDAIAPDCQPQIGLHHAGDVGERLTLAHGRGLYDMTGNAWQRVPDWYRADEVERHTTK